MTLTFQLSCWAYTCISNNSQINRYLYNGNGNEYIYGGLVTLDNGLYTEAEQLIRAWAGAATCSASLALNRFKFWINLVDILMVLATYIFFLYLRALGFVQAIRALSPRGG